MVSRHGFRHYVFSAFAAKRMLGRSGRRVFVLLALALVMAITASISAAGEPAGRPDWPPFQMTYEEFGYPSGVSAPPTTDTWILTWHGLGRWEKQLIGSEANPRAAGDTYRFDGERFIVDLSLPGTEDITIDHTDDVPVLPNSWLVPGRDASLAAIGFRKVAGPSADLTRYQRDVAVPCAAAEPGNQPTSCAARSTFTRRETILYTTDTTPPMPVELWDEVDGLVIWRVSVLNVALSTE